MLSSWTSVIAAVPLAVDPPPIWQAWLVALVVGVAGYVIATVRPMLVLLVLPASLVVDWLLIRDLVNPALSPSIFAANGQAYVVQTYLAAGAALVLPLAGMVKGLARR